MIILKRGDITQQHVDVIVNAANSGLKGGGGVDGAIHLAAGPTVMTECRALGGCLTGQAVITGAGKLFAKKIIHAVGPVWHGGNKNESQLLRDAYKNSFLLARREGLKRIALPAMSTGVYRFPIHKATEIALKAGKYFDPDFNEIVFVCFSTADLEIYEEIWKLVKNS